VFAYLKGLLSEARRKNSWNLAEQAGELTPDGMQRPMNAAKWNADAVRDGGRAYTVEHLGQRGVGVLDGTGFLEQGKGSVGVQRQYCGTAGRIENCRIGVFLGYCTSEGFSFLDRALYLPKEWTDERARCRAAGVPESVQFATKPRLAQAMLERAHRARVRFGWITADTVYGNDRKLRLWLEERQQAYVPAVACTEKLWMHSSGGSLQLSAGQATARQGCIWSRLGCGAGAKGPRHHDWAVLPLAAVVESGWGKWLLARRSLGKPEELAYFRVFAPVSTALAKTVEVVQNRSNFGT
jgi:SRSO17 transposase